MLGSHLPDASYNKFDFNWSIASPFRGSFTLFILMNFPIHINRYVIVHFEFKGLPEKISINYAFLSLNFFYR